MTKNRERLDKAVNLRKEGRSYSEISLETGIAKSTLSDWFSKEQWSQSVKVNLNNKYSPKNRARILLMNKSKTLKKEGRYDTYQQEAVFQYRKIKRNPLFIAGISIYWGEGEKFNTGRVSVINTDTEMMQVMIAFYRKILKVPESKIRAGLFVYEDLDPTRVQSHWASLLQLSQNQFIKTHILPGKRKPGKKRSVWGMCNIYVCSTELKIKMMRWIKTFALEYSKN